MLFFWIRSLCFIDGVWTNILTNEKYKYLLCKVKDSFCLQQIRNPVIHFDSATRRKALEASATLCI